MLRRLPCPLVALLWIAVLSPYGHSQQTLVTFDRQAVALFVGSIAPIGFDNVPGNGGGGAFGNPGTGVFPASAVDDEYWDQGLLVSSTGGPAVAVSVLGLPNQTDAVSLPNVLGGTTLNASQVTVIDYTQPICFGFHPPRCQDPATTTLAGAWLDPTGSRVRLTVYDTNGSPLHSVEGDEGQFIGIAMPGIARAEFTVVAFQTAAGFSLDDLYVAPVAGSCGPVELYCTSGTSSNGCLAKIAACGTPSATASSGFHLMASDVEGDKNGLFFFGSNGRQANPWGTGTSYQCVVPPVKRAGLLTGTGTAGSCDGSFTQDLNARWCPTCPKAVQNPGAGAVVQATLWYRDPTNTSSKKTALADAVEFTLCP